MSRKVIAILALALIFAFVSKAPAQEIDSFVVVDSICFPQADSIGPVGVDGYGDYLWFASLRTDSGYRIDLSGTILSSSPLPYGGHASAFYVDANYVYYGPIIDRVFVPPTWTPQASGTSNILMGVYFTDANFGWAVGYDGAILHTADGGNSWNPQTSGTSEHLYGVYFTDANIGWAVGYDGTILHTTDGGTNWNPQTSGTSDRLYSVCFSDANTGWVVGQFGIILHTTDGGTNWNAQTSGVSNWLLSVCFSDANTGWAVGSSGAILHTTNGGTNWNAQTSGTSNSLWGVYFAYANRGWAVGDDGTILHTSDGGTNWNAQTSGTSNRLYSVCFIYANTGWVVGTDGTILHTTDGGSTWTTQNSGTSAWLFGVHFTDTYTGWAVGGGGTILHYTNGWHYVYGIIKYDWDWNILDTLDIPPIPREDTLGFRSEDLGFDGSRWWVAGRYGNIYSWAPPETTLTLEFHHSISDSGGHLDGLEAVGNSIYLSEMLTDTIYQYDKDGDLIKKYAYSGEEGGTYLEGMGFDPHGNFWYSSGWSTNCLYELGGIEVAEKICDFFLTPKKLNLKRNAEHTFMIHLRPCEPMDVSKGDSAEVYVDVDGDCTFESDELYPAVVNSPSMVIKVYCPDLIDNDPKVGIYSVNNIPISDTLGNDVVMYLDTFTPKGKGPKSLATASPDQFALSQNYPNPFNPETDISFSLPERTQVSLVIYNVLGEKVKTLVDDYMDAGVHTITWDGTNDRGKVLSSGVYFYRVVAGDEVVTKKMMLMK